jgi:hypothetical protein
MRDFRDAKVMAQALRSALKYRAIETSHSESLELIAKAFGYDNWNILSSKIGGTARASAVLPVVREGASEPTMPRLLRCSFCSKSQRDVRKLIAGPSVYICDECVEICLDVIREEGMLDRLLKSDEESGDPSRPDGFELARGTSSEELANHVARSRKHVERSRFHLEGIERRLAMREGDDPAKDDILALPGYAHLQAASRQELLALQQSTQNYIKRCEEALRIATAVLAERGAQSG